METVREGLMRLAEELHPGNKLFAQLMSNAADTQEKIAEAVITQYMLGKDDSTS